MTNDHRTADGPVDDEVSARPDFLSLPARTRKPRRTGISHVLDDGVPLAEVRARLAGAADRIDLWKFGWGTAYLDRELSGKLAALAAHDVRACTGGTLLEIAWSQGAMTPFLDWAEAVGFPCIEVSCGTVTMTRTAKDDLIGTIAERFTVLAEVGSKDPDAPVSKAEWAADARADLAAGAAWVVTEGRASGTVGLFSRDGEVRTDVVDAVVAAVGIEHLLFEAPQRDQQAWLIRRYGSDVNLGNIRLSDITSVESLRVGLRSDTIDSLPQPVRPDPAPTIPEGIA